MPKSNFLRKKNKKGGTADFKRPKAKVGKRAPQAASHTDTSFKSKRVKVSAQSILHDLGDADAITARGQGVKELLIQLGHYSPATKREALIGLKSIVDRHRGFVEANFGKLAEASLELAVCFDSDVRTALLAFQEALLACASARTFSPFANLYMAYVVSAMTSLDAGVRRDSISLLALLLARFPCAVAERAERLAPNYPALFSVETGAKSQTGMAAALRSLETLFGAVSLRYGGGDGNGSFQELDNASAHAHSTRGGTGSVFLWWKRGSRRNCALMLCPLLASATSKSWSDPSIGVGTAGAGADSPSMALFTTLPRMLERLREVWMEAIAAVSPDMSVMQSVVDVLLAAISAFPRCAGVGRIGGRSPDRVRRCDTVALPLLPPWRVDKDHRKVGENEDWVSADSSAWFARFVPLVLEVFPLRLQEGELLLEGAAEAERVRATERLNMALCELVVAVCAGPTASAAVQKTMPTAAGWEGEEGDASDWLSPILAHVHEVLRDGAGRTGSLGPQIPSVLRVLNAATRNHAGVGMEGSDSWTTQRQRLLAAFGDFFEALPPRSEAKLLCVRFVCKMTKTLLSSSATSGTLRETVANDSEVAREVRRWLQSLPDLLCVWGAEFPASSAASIRALVEVAKRAPSPSPPHPGGEKGKAKGKPSAAMAAEMAAAIATGGAWASESLDLLCSMKPTVLGEFFSGRGFPYLPASAQMDAVSLLYHLPSIPACVVLALASVCSEPDALRDDVRSFVLEVMHHRRRSLSPSAYLGFLVSVLTGVSPYKHLGGSKRTAPGAGSVVTDERGGGGKRQRQWPAAAPGGCVAQRRVTGEATPSAARTLWETVFRRDEVTGVVCNSLAMMGTRGGALLEALRPTLLQLLRREGWRGTSGRGRRACAQGGACGDGLGSDLVGALMLNDSRNDAESLASLIQGDGESLPSLLQHQRAAMACVLCCWDGLDIDPSTTQAAATATAAALSSKSESPLSPLKGPMAAACVQAMKVAGTEGAQEQSRGARLMRPVLVLVKRWPDLLPSMLSLIVDAASDVTTSETAPSQGEDLTVARSVGLGRFRALEPLLRCLQALVRDPSLQGRIRRRHLGALQQTARALYEVLEGSPLQDVVVQLRADVDLLGDGSRN